MIARHTVAARWGFCFSAVVVMKRRFARFYLVSLAVIIALGVVLWHRYYYDPQVAILRAMPRGHHLVQRVDADVDGDGRWEVIFASGRAIGSNEETTPATLTVLRWRGWHWLRCTPLFGQKNSQFKVESCCRFSHL